MTSLITLHLYHRPLTSSYNNTGEVNAESGVKEISDKELNLPLLKKTRVHVLLESPRRELEELIQARTKFIKIS